MNRRKFVAALGAAATFPAAVFAQTPSRTFRIGLLAGGGPITDKDPFGAPLIRSLAKHGYVQERNLAFERRGMGGKPENAARLISVLPLGVRGPEDFDQAFAAITREKADAILARSRPTCRSSSRSAFAW